MQKLSHLLQSVHTEGSPSGLWRRLGKAVCGQLHREFESLSLRHKKGSCMFIVWKKSGYLIPIIGLGNLVVTQAVVDMAYGKGYYTSHSRLYATLALCLAAILTYLIYERRLKARDKPRHLQDLHTKQIVIDRNESSFFFIPFRWYPLIFVAFAVYGALFISK